MRKVKFDRVCLTGFGPYRETTTFSFAEGLNVLVAPNETGKSTLVAGINALLFGLPQTTDETVFGQARYRNWYNPPGFEGELVFTVDGESYRLRRSFQNNQVSLARKEEGGYRELVAGIHNPRAQRRNLRFEEALKDLLGLSSQELFTATFCLTQPLPEAEELNERVQELLSGTGVGFNRVTEGLAKELREITRFTGRRGVTSRDAVEPRALEKVMDEIAKTRAAMEADRELVDRLEDYRRQLEAAEKQRTTKAKVLAEQEELLGLWQEWQQLMKSYEAARLVYSQLRKSTERAGELQRERERIAEEKAGYPWGPTVPAETGELLQQLRALTEQKTGLARELAALEAETVRPAADKGEEAGPQAAFTVDWAALGPGPVAVVESRQREAREALAVWEEGQELERAAAENARLRRDEFALFEEADQAVLAAVEVYDSRLAFLRSALENATLRREKAKTELKRLEERGRLRWGVTVLGAVLGGVIPAFLAAGPAKLLWILGGILLGAGLGYLAGRPLFSPGVLNLFRKEVAKQEEEVQAAAEALDQFERQVAPFKARYPDLTGAYRQWTGLVEKGEDLDRQYRDFCRRELGGFSGPAAVCPLSAPGLKVNPRWRDLHAFARVVTPGEKLESLGGLMAWLAAKTPGWWERLLSEAAVYEEKRAEEKRLAGLRQAKQEYLAKTRQKAAELTEMEEELKARIMPLLEAAGGDCQKAGQLWTAWRELCLRAEKAENAFGQILALEKVDTLEELEAKCDDAALKAQSYYQQRQALVAAHPGLAPLETAATPEQLETEYRKRQEEVARTRSELQALDGEIRRLTMELARLEGQEPINLAEAEESLAQLEAERAALEMECEALTLAYQELTAALQDFQGSYRLRLAEMTTAYFRELTAGQERRVELDENFQVKVVIDGRPVTPAQLSYGARDQLFIALRLGIARLLAADLVLPFIFDDPFLNCDAGRLAKIRRALEVLAQKRQLILLSHRADFAAWGIPVPVKTGA